MVNLRSVRSTPAAEAPFDPDATPTQRRILRSRSKVRAQHSSTRPVRDVMDQYSSHMRHPAFALPGNLQWSVINDPDAPTTPTPMLDILRLRLPAHPPFCSFSDEGKHSTDTRDPSGREIKFDVKDQLKYILPFHPLVDQLFGHVRVLLNDRVARADDPWITSMHPYYTIRQLPSRISTEHDSEDLAWGVLARPAVSIIQSLSEVPPWVSKSQFPNIRSCGGRAHIPDGILLGNHEKDIRMVYEVKTDAVLSSTSLLYNFDALMTRWENMPLGRDVLFQWPKSKAPLSKETKVFVQIWCQIIDKNVDFAMLTSYSRTYFFVRHPQQRNTLVISREYRLDSSPTLLATFAFTALALGKIPMSALYIPPVQTRWRAEVINYQELADNWDGMGSDPNTYPSAYEGEIVVRSQDL